jgi:phage shock protein PspC (stress-responsive transcriptional regulator)
METLSNYFRQLFEKGMFGVLSFIGERMGIATSKIRLFFIYISFLTLGAIPIVIYLTLAFILNIGRYIKYRKRNPVWDF